MLFSHSLDFHCRHWSPKCVFCHFLMEHWISAWNFSNSRKSCFHGGLLFHFVLSIYFLISYPAVMKFRWKCYSLMVFDFDRLKLNVQEFSKETCCVDGLWWLDLAVLYQPDLWLSALWDRASLRVSFGCGQYWPGSNELFTDVAVIYWKIPYFVFVFQFYEISRWARLLEPWRRMLPSSKILRYHLQQTSRSSKSSRLCFAVLHPHMA